MESMRVGIAGSVLLTAGLWLGSSLGVSRANPDYQGVCPGSHPEAPHRLPGRPGAAVVTLPGFQMRPDGSSMVFIQTGIEPQPRIESGKGKLTLVLPGLSLPPGNVRRPMDTHFFNSPVTRVELHRRKGGVVVSLDMRAAVQPRLDVKRSETGYYFVTLTFPAGSYR